MNQVTTPVRLPEEEYKKYRRIALEQRKSFAQLVREALKNYQQKEISKEVIKRRKAAAARLWKTQIPVDIPIKELIEAGRRF